VHHPHLALYTPVNFSKLVCITHILYSKTGVPHPYLVQLSLDVSLGVLLLVLQTIFVHLAGTEVTCSRGGHCPLLLELRLEEVS